MLSSAALSPAQRSGVAHTWRLSTGHSSAAQPQLAAPRCTAVLQRQQRSRCAQSFGASPAPPMWHQRRTIQARATGGGDGGMDRMYEDLFSSHVFQSEMVVREFDKLTSELMGLSRMAPRFPDFDLAGKRLFLDQMEDCGQRYRIFIKRLELSEDPAAREYLRRTNAQMLEGGFTLHQMFDGLTQSLTDYRRWVDEEDRASADPVTHQRFLQGFKAAWAQSAMGRIDLDFLSKLPDKSVLMNAQRDPQFYAAIKEISDSPSQAVLSKWIEHPTIGPLVREIVRAQLNKSMS